MPPKKGGKKIVATTGGRSQSGIPAPLLLSPRIQPAHQRRQEVGPYWDRLRQLVDEAQEAAINGHDHELDNTGRDTAEALEFRFQEQEAIDATTGGRNEDEAERFDAFATNTAARLMNHSGRQPYGSRLSGRLALLYLMRADWQFQLALDTLQDNLNAGDEELIQDAEEEEERQEREDQGRQPTAVARPQTQQPNAEQMRLAGLNPNADREPALSGQPNPGKFTITLNQPSGGTKSYPYSRQQGLNWSSAEDVRTLNKWRAQVFLRRLGPKQEARVQYQEVELLWLENYIANLEAQAITAGASFDLSLIDFRYLAQTFNQRFQGLEVPGSDVPRPHRTIPSLRSELGRIPEVVRMTGMAVKKKAPTKGGPPRRRGGGGGGRGGRGGGKGGEGGMK